MAPSVWPPVEMLRQILRWPDPRVSAGALRINVLCGRGVHFAYALAILTYNCSPLFDDPAGRAAVGGGPAMLTPFLSKVP